MSDRHRCFAWIGKILASVMMLCLVTGKTLARPVQLWSESELFEKADLVVLVKAKGAKDVPAVRSAPPKPETWIEIETTFEVQAVLKGKPVARPLAVRHHRYHHSNGETIVINGPAFVEFRAKQPRQYLAFLKEVKVDGQSHYEPLTGQYDPNGSFFLVQPYHVNREREAADEEKGKIRPAQPTAKDAARGL